MTCRASLPYRNYDIKTFRNDLKEVLKRAGVEGKPTMLFLEDYQILEPAFLEYVNSLLSGGKKHQGDGGKASAADWANHQYLST